MEPRINFKIKPFRYQVNRQRMKKTIKNDGWITVNCSFNLNIKDIMNEENLESYVIQNWNTQFKEQNDISEICPHISFEDDYSEIIDECKYWIQNKLKETRESFLNLN